MRKAFRAQVSDINAASVILLLGILNLLISPFPNLPYFFLSGLRTFLAPVYFTQMYSVCINTPPPIPPPVLLYHCANIISSFNVCFEGVCQSKARESVKNIWKGESWANLTKSGLVFNHGIPLFTRIIKEPGEKSHLTGSLTGKMLQTSRINLQFFLCWIRAMIELKSVFLKYDGSSWRLCLYLKVRGHFVVKIWILT